MDTPNPLDNFQYFTVLYVLCAFQYTEDACKTDIDGSVGPVGTMFSGNACGGNAAVIVNNFANNADNDFKITKFESDFSYYGSLSPSTTQMLGSVEILDRYGGWFPTFMQQMTEQIGDMSETHLAFSLRVFFVSNDNQIVSTKPLIFNMITMTQNMTSYSQHAYTLFWAACYNTVAQFPGFSKLYQTTITNQNSNPSTEVPKPDVPGSSIIPRAVEDAQKASPRQTRIDKSKTMQTLKDVFEGMAEDLMQQKYVHKRQLQEWLGYVRDDYVKKIAVPVQHKPPGYLPVDYRLLFDDAYSGAQIDNRNMVFEQPEQSQLSKGIRVVNIPEGETLPGLFDKLMKLSTQVSKDYLSGKTYKTIFIILRRCEGKYDLFMKLKQIQIPYNSQSRDTGPGDNPDPLEFYYQSVGTSDLDVMSLQGKLNSNIFLNTLEQQIDDPDAKIVFGNREQGTAERNANLDFFKTFFSGVRMNINNHNNSSEFMDHAGNIDNMLSPNINGQTNVFSLYIKGNPDVMSDINRNPFWVYQGQADNPVHYQFPEYSPMYIKVLVNLTPTDPTNGDSDNISEMYYYSNYYHIYKIKTIIEGNDFHHELGLLRTDDIS